MTKEGEILLLFTIRKRSLRRLCFYMCLSFCPQGGCLGPGPGGRLGGLASRVSRPRSRGSFGGSGWGVSRPRPEGVVSKPRPGGCPGPGLGCVSQHALRQTPPPQHMATAAVRILLECILVSYHNFKSQDNGNNIIRYCPTKKNNYNFSGDHMFIKKNEHYLRDVIVIRAF